MKTVMITGGTGLIGQELTQLLTEVGYQVIIMGRQRPQSPSRDPKVKYAQWDVKNQTMDVQALQEADYIVHLAGANVAAQRWSAARKQEILNSRTRSSQLIVDMLGRHPNKVTKVISAAATGFYGESYTRTFTEEDSPADDFLGTTCVAWENSIKPVQDLGKKLVIFRTGITLSRAGGALAEFYRPLRLGVAAILGSGEQWVSWIHVHDLVRLYLNAIVNDSLEGIFNAVAPNPVTNERLVLAMAQAARNKNFVPVHAPAFALKLILGEMSVEVLKSCKVSSRKVEDTGFQFSYPAIDDAMDQLFKQQ